MDVHRQVCFRASSFENRVADRQAWPDQHNGGHGAGVGGPSAENVERSARDAVEVELSMGAKVMMVVKYSTIKM